MPVQKLVIWNAARPPIAFADCTVCVWLPAAHTEPAPTAVTANVHVSPTPSGYSVVLPEPDPLPSTAASTASSSPLGFAGEPHAVASTSKTESLMADRAGLPRRVA